MQNIEIKSVLRDRAAMEQRLAVIGAKRKWSHQQIDTFFKAESGWLKLRQVATRPTELIAYHRSVTDNGPRACDYERVYVDEGDKLYQVLTTALSISGKVTKERTLWCYKHTRIHLDRVDDLGDFIELETVLTDCSAAAGMIEHTNILDLLHLKSEDFIAIPYFKMLLDSA